MKPNCTLTPEQEAERAKLVAELVETRRSVREGNDALNRQRLLFERLSDEFCMTHKEIADAAGDLTDKTISYALTALERERKGLPSRDKVPASKAS